MNKDAFDDLRLPMAKNTFQSSEIINAYCQALDDVYEEIKKNPARFGLSVMRPNVYDIKVIEPGSIYSIPVFAISKDGLTATDESVNIYFVKGTKEAVADSDIANKITVQTGVVAESLVQTAIEYLKSVNVGPLANRETALAITKFEEGLNWLERRHTDRLKRGVSETHKP
jgi:hypothetical protein